MVLPAQNLCLQQNCLFPLPIFHRPTVVHTMIVFPSIGFSLSPHSSYSSCAFACLMTTAAGVVRVANKFRGTALQKELQGFASFLAFQNSYFRNGTAMTKVIQERVLAESILGTLMIQTGLTLFSNLWRVLVLSKICTMPRKRSSRPAFSRQATVAAT